MARTETLASHPYLSQIRLLLQSALLIFAYTVVIGILNGTDLVEFSHKQLLTHVHTGTLGWITTAVFAGALWLFGATPGTGMRDSLARTLPMATVVGVIDPPPDVTAKPTLAPVTRFPQASLTLTTIGSARGCDAPPAWLLPEMIES